MSDYSAIYIAHGKQYCKLHHREIEQHEWWSGVPAEHFGPPQEVIVEGMYTFPNHTKYTDFRLQDTGYPSGWKRSTWCPSCATLAREFEQSLPPREAEFDPLSMVL